MNRIHALAASTIIGLAAIFGVAAMSKTAGVGASKPAASQVSDELIAARQRKLDRAERALRKVRAEKPPTLPAVPLENGLRPPARVISQPALSASASSSTDDDDEDDEDEFEDD